MSASASTGTASTAAHTTCTPRALRASSGTSPGKLERVLAHARTTPARFAWPVSTRARNTLLQIAQQG
jgi:hypothetical protein